MLLRALLVGEQSLFARTPVPNFNQSAAPACLHQECTAGKNYYSGSSQSRSSCSRQHQLGCHCWKVNKFKECATVGLEATAALKRTANQTRSCCKAVCVIDFAWRKCAVAFGSEGMDAWIRQLAAGNPWVSWGTMYKHVKVRTRVITECALRCLRNLRWIGPSPLFEASQARARVTVAPQQNMVTALLPCASASG